MATKIPGPGQNLEMQRLVFGAEPDQVTVNRGPLLMLIGAVLTTSAAPRELESIAEMLFAGPEADT